MASHASEIIDDLIAMLRDADLFTHVTLGPSAAESGVPRAIVLYDGVEWLAADDSAAARWGRLRATILVRTRSQDVLQGVRRVDALCASAADALLADPYRGGRCEDLPVGRATDVGRRQLSRTAKRPEIEMSFDVRCHFQTEDD